MAEDVSATIQEILDLTGDTQTVLGRKVGVGQSTINRWLNRVNTPNKKQWDRVQELLREAKGYALTIDQKIAPYDEDTRRIIRDMVDDYLKRIPPPRRTHK